MDLLPFLNVCIELSDTPECEFVHKIDAVRTGDKLPAEFLHGNGEGCAEQTDLMFFIAHVDYLFQDRLELW
jgi:hypothetical protein